MWAAGQYHRHGSQHHPAYSGIYYNQRRGDRVFTGDDLDRAGARYVQESRRRAEAQQRQAFERMRAAEEQRQAQLRQMQLDKQRRAQEAWYYAEQQKLYGEARQNEQDDREQRRTPVYMMPDQGKEQLRSNEQRRSQEASHYAEQQRRYRKALLSERRHEDQRRMATHAMPAQERERRSRLDRPEVRHVRAQRATPSRVSPDGPGRRYA